MNREEWIDYYESINGHKPSILEVYKAEKNGDIFVISESSNPLTIENQDYMSNHSPNYRKKSVWRSLWNGLTFIFSVLWVLVKFAFSLTLFIVNIILTITFFFFPSHRFYCSLITLIFIMKCFGHFFFLSLKHERRTMDELIKNMTKSLRQYNSAATKLLIDVKKHADEIR